MRECIELFEQVKKEIEKSDFPGVSIVDSAAVIGNESEHIQNLLIYVLKVKTQCVVICV